MVNTSKPDGVCYCPFVSVEEVISGVHNNCGGKVDESKMQTKKVRQKK